jgi:hypothetical protein
MFWIGGDIPGNRTLPHSLLSRTLAPNRTSQHPRIKPKKKICQIQVGEQREQ